VIPKKKAQALDESCYSDAVREVDSGVVDFFEHVGCLTSFWRGYVVGADLFAVVDGVVQHILQRHLMVKAGLFWYL